MKEYIGLTSWLDTNFIEKVLYARLHSANKTVCIPALDDRKELSIALEQYNETLGKPRRVVTFDSESNQVRMSLGINGGKDWSEYNQFVIPVNTGANHNEAIILFPNSVPKKAIFIDPMGHPIPEKRRRELEELGFRNISSTRAVQRDGYHCGDYSIELVSQILSKEDPAALTQEDLNEITDAVGKYDKPRLDKNRADYVHEYLMTLTGDEANPITNQVLVSESLIAKIRQEQRDLAYRSPYLLIKSDEEVQRLDVEASIRAASAYREYTERLRLESSSERSVKQPLDRRSTSTERSPIETKLTEAELEKQKALLRRHKTAQLDTKIVLLQTERELLEKLQIKESLELSDIQTLINNAVNIQEIKSRLLELEASFELLSVDLVIKSKEIARVFDSAIEEPQVESMDAINESITDFLKFEDLVKIAEPLESIDQITPLYRIAKEYEEKLLELQDAQALVREKELEHDKLNLLGVDKHDVVKRWKILHQIIIEVKSNYREHLDRTGKRGEEEANRLRVEDKFNTFTQYGATFGDGVDVAGLSYQGLAKALYDCYQEMFSREPKVFGSSVKMSDSRRLLLLSLRQIDIVESDFSSERKLEEKIGKINFSSDNEVVLNNLFRPKSGTAVEFLDTFSELFLIDRLKKQHNKEVLNVARHRAALADEGLKEYIRLNKANLLKIKAFVAKCSELGLSDLEVQYKDILSKCERVQLEIKQNEAKGSESKEMIQKNPRGYITSRLEEIETASIACKKELDELAAEEFKGIKQKIIAPDQSESLEDTLESHIAETQILGEHFRKLASSRVEGLDARQKVIFNGMLDRILSSTNDKSANKQLRHAKSGLAKKVEVCNQLVLNGEDRKPGALHAAVQELHEQMSITYDLMAQAKQQLTEGLVWLLMNSDQEVVLPEGIVALDFSHMDLRGVDLSRVKDHSGETFDFSYSIFNQTKLGLMSEDELSDNLQNLKKLIGVRPSVSIKELHQALVNFANQELKSGVSSGEEFEQFKTHNIEQVKKIWEFHFPNFRVELSNDDNLSEILRHLNTITQSIEHHSGLETQFPVHMDFVNFSQAKFIGEINNTSLEYAIMPKDLRGVKFKSCLMHRAKFDGCIVDENTKFSVTADGLRGIVPRVTSKGESISLAGLIIDGHKGGSLPRDLRGFDLSGAVLLNLNLDEYIIDETTKLNRVIFNNISFNNCQITKAQFSDCQFEQCEFIGEKLDMTAAEFDGCTFNQLKLGNGLEFNEREGRFGVKIQSSFKNCKFRGTTELSSHCDISMSCFNNVYFEELSLDWLGCTLPTDTERNTNISIKQLNNGSSISKQELRGTVLANSKITKIVGVSADTFIDQFDDQVQRLAEVEKRSTSEIRKRAFDWFRKHISQVSGYGEYIKVLGMLKKWQQGESENNNINKLDYKWRLFNHYKEGIYKRGATRPSKLGNLMIQMVENTLKKIETEHAVATHDNQLPHEYKFLQKAFNQLLDPQETLGNYKRLAINPIIVDAVEKIRRGKKAFGADIFSRYAHSAISMQTDRESATMQQMRGFTSVMVEKNHFDHSIKALVSLLISEKPAMIEEVIENWKPLELFQAVLALELTHPDLAAKLTDSDCYRELREQVKFVALTYEDLLKSAIFDTLENLAIKDKKLAKFFIEMLRELPLSKRAFLNVANAQRFIEGRDSGDIFVHDKISVATRMEYLNEVLKLFDDDYQFFGGSEQADVNAIRKEFRRHFTLDNKTFRHRVSNNKEAYPPERQRQVETFLESEASIGSKEHPTVSWPRDRSTEFTGDEQYYQLQDIVTGWACEKAQASQIDQYVRKVVSLALGRYYLDVDKKNAQINKRFNGIAEVLPNGNIKHTWLSGIERSLYTLKDLEDILEHINKTRGAGKRLFNEADRAGNAFNYALNNIKQNEIFKSMSDGSQLVVTHSGKLPKKITFTSGLLGLLSARVGRRVTISDSHDRSSRYNPNDTKIKVLKGRVKNGFRFINETIDNLIDTSKALAKHQKQLQSVEEGSFIDTFLEFVGDYDPVKAKKYYQQAIVGDKERLTAKVDKILKLLEGLKDNLSGLNKLGDTTYKAQDIELIQQAIVKIKENKSVENIQVECQKVVAVQKREPAVKGQRSKAPKIFRDHGQQRTFEVGHDIGQVG
ncbi:MAG: hypothetical protein EP298_12210 [Gammaproteobacteria bacterium]|nr:MAG: hypothetical protein EP298_12210 [Gammaproteobacteria bacterium]UTW43058.1 pentapeptide repeat-containing protein [bacterium SCSIO 12844]